MIGVEHYLTVAAVLFVIGIFGIFLNRKNVIILLMSLELILLSVNINMVAFSSYLGDLAGQVFTLFILTVAAAEAAIGLAILVCFFRNRGSIAVEDVNVMKGLALLIGYYGFDTVVSGLYSEEFLDQPMSWPKIIGLSRVHVFMLRSD